MPGFDNDVVYAGNLDFSGGAVPAAQLVTDGQLIIGSTGLNPAIATLASADASTIITNGAGTIDLTAVGLSQDNMMYVGKHGNDAWDGLTPSKAKLTIQAGVTAAAAGDTIIVYPGSYTETITHTANNVTLIARGKPNSCIITQADANVINFAGFTGIQYKYFRISCTAATTAINTIQGTTGTCAFKECQLRMVSAANIVAVAQPAIGAITGAGRLTVHLGSHQYLHTGVCGGTAQKGAFVVANGGLIHIGLAEGLTITNSGTALVSGVGIDLASTGNFELHDNQIIITDPDATNIVGLAYIGGTGSLHEFFRNNIHVIATNNTGYGFFAGDTATVSRFFYNHVHVTDVAGTSYSYHIGNTSTVISHFDDLVAADGEQLVGGGTFTVVASETDGGLSVTDLTQHAPVIGGGSGALTPLGPLTNGQLIIGSTGAAPVAAALVSGDASVTITPGAGSIDLAAAGGGLAWSVEAGAAVAAAVDSGYITNRGAGITYTIPTTAAVGSIIRICSIAGLWTIAQNAAESIVFGAFTTTVGVGGSLVATNVGDTIEIINTVADTQWAVLSSVGNITIN